MRGVSGEANLGGRTIVLLNPLESAQLEKVLYSQTTVLQYNRNLRSTLTSSLQHSLWRKQESKPRKRSSTAESRDDEMYPIAQQVQGSEIVR